MDDLNVFFAFLRFPMTHAFPSISNNGSVFYVVESCSTFNGLSIANADKKCQGDVLASTHNYSCGPAARPGGERTGTKSPAPYTIKRISECLLFISCTQQNR